MFVTVRLVSSLAHSPEEVILIDPPTRKKRVMLFLVCGKTRGKRPRQSRTFVNRRN